MNVEALLQNQHTKTVGRPRKKENGTLLHVYIEKEAKLVLKNLSKKYDLSMSQILEILLLNISEEEYVLKLAKENEKLKKELELLKQELNKLEEKNRVASSEIDNLKRRINEIFGSKTEIKVVELVKKLYGLPDGDERVHSYAEKFITSYFREVDKTTLESSELGLRIEKYPKLKSVGWKVKKIN